jgi:predicted dehydrogenase
MFKINKSIIMVLGSLLIVSSANCVMASESSQKAPIRLGMIGLDTSHVIAFTQRFNDPNNSEYVPGFKVVAGFKGGSADIPTSADRVDGYTKKLQDDWGVKIYDSVEELCQNVDGVLIESVDGRPHLGYARQVIKAGLPFFVDKPVGGTYEDVLEIAKLAKKANVPWFGGSSLRWWSGMSDALNPEKIGEVLGCDAYSPCSYEKSHPDLFWYGVHGMSLLYGAMGPGCKSVSRTHTEDTDVVVGVWDDGRIGTFRGLRAGKHNYGARIYGSKGNSTVEGHSYKGLLEAISNFFKTKKPPLSAEEIVEMYAFMNCADISKQQGGKPVDLPKISLD